ncbi:glycosyltransferase family 2 protein [Selenomonas montiformis]|uniref:glycosyltransferase family 2 protein n=1 Tax=Selenomonas montiformis TaxID=2652285 RepID=UPI003F8AED2B
MSIAVSPRVAVMMSTYNGEKYLREQIDSILQQDDVIVDLYIRDDGSSDGTAALLKEYDMRANVHVDYAENIGVIASFMNLLYNVPKTYNYYAFSDQDDFWLKEKLKAAIDRIQEEHLPNLYFSRKKYVDETLKPLPMTDYIVRGTTIGFALMNSCASGCTMVFNRVLCDKLCQWRPDPRYMSMHDAWIYIVAAAIGNVVYDPDSYILYRQHGDNVSLLGSEMRNSPWKHWKLRFKTLLDRRHDFRRSYYAKQVLDGYGDELRPDVYNLVYDLANVRKSKRSKMRLIMSNTLQTQISWEIYFIKVFILCGWI